MGRVPVRRTAHRLLPDARRVIAKPHMPGDEGASAGDSRARILAQRILALPEAEVAGLLGGILADFGGRHARFEGVLDDHFDRVARHLGAVGPLSAQRRRLVGAYFTHEYSVEGAALFNPSIVWAPGQADSGAGRGTFVMSLRAVGEGHISSIEFRSGSIDASGDVVFAPLGRTLATGQRTSPDSYDKAAFLAKLVELDAGNALALSVLDRIPDRFTLLQLDEALVGLEHGGPPHAVTFETAKIIRVLAASSYVTTFDADSALDERVLFPAGPHETHGMEDARFVRFTEKDGSVRYYATYTAYDGFEILPQLIETRDFLSFAVSTLHGGAARNKGMALFPRRIDGHYVMLSRRDRENLYVAVSDDVRSWENASPIYQPRQPWELLQIGNCGSPLETEAGWLVLTHGVGPMRRYALGALLLDLQDPRRVIGHLAEPLLTPDESEREGYVPNVLYSCGGIVRGEHLVLPYGFSDQGIGIAVVPLPALLAELTALGPPCPSA